MIKNGIYKLLLITHPYTKKQYWTDVHITLYTNYAPQYDKNIYNVDYSQDTHIKEGTPDRKCDGVMIQGWIDRGQLIPKSEYGIIDKGRILERHTMI